MRISLCSEIVGLEQRSHKSSPASVCSSRMNTAGGYILFISKETYGVVERCQEKNIFGNTVKLAVALD